MKIALILNSFPEISEKFLLNHLIGLVQSGADITILAAHRNMSGPRHAIFDEFKIADYTEWLDIPRNPLFRFFHAPILFFSLLVRSPGAAIKAIQIYKYKTMAKNCKCLYYGNRLLGRHYDIVHCHFGTNGLIGSYLKDIGVAQRLVTAFHGSDINSYPKRYGHALYEYLYKRADMITSNTRFTASKIIANGGSPSLIKIVPEPLIASEYENLDRSTILPYSLLTVGRLEEKKGHRYVIEALALVRKQVPAVRYYIVGGGSLEAELRTLAKQHGVEDICYFEGMKTGEEVRSYYASCQVFTLPSVQASNGDMEGQGLVIQEAQMCGLPVITTRHNGIPDGLLDGETGFLLEERDVSGLAKRITELLTDDALRAKMGKRGIEFVRSGYDITPITARLLGYYREILASEASSR